MSLLDNYLYNCARTFVLHESPVLLLLLSFFRLRKGWLEGALRDDPKNGCEGDYYISPSK